MWIEITGQTIWWLMPALTANMAPVILTYFDFFPAMNFPLDFGLNWHGQRLLGKNKTWRGLLSGVFVGAITALFQYTIQRNAWPFEAPWLIQDWKTAIMIGVLLGLGALLGDSIKSFIKRRLRIYPGRSWSPWDQIDIVIGSLLTTWWLIPWTSMRFAIAIVLVGAGSYIVSRLGVILKVKQSI